MKYLTIIPIILSLPSCFLYQGDNGLSFFKPYYMDRARYVSADDLKILQSAKDILNNKNNWNRDDDRLCFHDEKWSLYCALAKASIIVSGKYMHRRVALQETRFTINDNFPDRWKVHQLMDFNNHPLTKFEDIIWVIEETKKRIGQRYIAN